MAEQNKILFRKGLLKNLKDPDKAPIIPGSINFTTDEPGIYLDVEEKGKPIRRRIGDIIIVENVTDLFNLDENGNLDLTPTEAAKALPQWSTSALYYVKKDNALLKWGGDDDQTWTRLNPSLEDVETGITDLDSRLTTLVNNYSEFINTTYPEDKNDLEDLIAANTNANQATQEQLNLLEERVNSINTNIDENYETKVDAAAKLVEAKNHTDALAEGAVATNTKNISAEVARATEVEEDLQSQINELSGTVTEQYTFISGSIDDLKKKDEDLTTAISEGDQNALTEANQYTDEQVDLINQKIEEVQGLLNNTSSRLDGEIDAAKDEAINTVIGVSDDNFDNKKTIYGLKNYVDNAMQTADAMTFIGVLGETEQGQIQSLPAAANTKAGDTYKVGIQGSYSNGVYTPRGTTGTIVYVGDLLIAKADGSNEYYHITSGYEDDYNTRLTKDSAYPNAVVLESIAGVYHGSVSFSGNADTNITATLTGDPPDSNNIATMNVEISMTWGSFDQ